MQDYETRILRPAGSIALISNGSHLNDFSAIRASQKLRRDGELVEVWRDEVCIYSECPSRTATLVWPIQDKQANA
jgi:hypothetical protein